MKKLFILLIASVMMTSCATMTPISGDIVSKTYHTTGSKSELYVKANLLMIDVFNDAESVIQFSDKDAGVFKGKCLLYSQAASTYTVSKKIYATVTVNVDDNIVKLTIKPDAYYNDIYNAAKNSVDKGIADIQNQFAIAFN